MLTPWMATLIWVDFTVLWAKTSVEEPDWHLLRVECWTLGNHLSIVPSTKCKYVSDNKRANPITTAWHNAKNRVKFFVVIVCDCQIKSSKDTTPTAVF